MGFIAAMGVLGERGVNMQINSYPNGCLFQHSEKGIPLPTVTPYDFYYLNFVELKLSGESCFSSAP